MDGQEHGKTHDDSDNALSACLHYVVYSFPCISGK